ncbi:hypothetical protein ES706_01818 [subsurface metagenome]
MKTLQIRLPEDLLKKVDEFIEKGFFKSRSQLLRKAISKYILEFNYTGTIPYIIGPFTPSEMELLKKDPKKSLEIPYSQLSKFQTKIKDLNE